MERHLTPIRIVFVFYQYSFAGTPLPVKVEFDQNGQILIGCLQTYLHAAFTSKEMGWGADIANYTMRGGSVFSYFVHDYYLTCV